MVLHEMLSYDTLRLLWWLLVGGVLVAYAVMDGLDLGAAMLLPWVARNDLERRVVIHSVGPVWEGNQVWLILGGGALFAAWPLLYAVVFSGFYLAMFAILVGLILRPVAFKFRSKREDPAWRARWDGVLCGSALVPALIFGVALGNVLQGVPFRLESDMRIFYEGSVGGLFNPFALLCGGVSVAMLVVHGSAWLRLKTTGAVAERARRYGRWAALMTALLYGAGGLVLWFFIEGYRITSPIVPAGPSNPLLKSAELHAGAWFGHYAAQPLLWLVPALGLLGALLAWLGLHLRREWLALLGSTASIVGIVLSVGVSMFPFLLPSSLDAHFSLTVWDASSSHLTLFIMLVSTAIFLPLIVAYTSWVYSVLRGKVDADAIRDESGPAY